MKIFITTLMSLLFVSSFAQDRTTVSAKNSEISDNLDLRAVASIFGDSKDLEDFEYRINDPKNQISNLDLNNDNQVDYLRVIESVEGNAHIIVLQAVLAKDTFQDVATVEVERDSNNRVQVQVVGDVYMYGANYIYEPVYVSVPVIYDYFWTPYYRPYCSSWYWGYYPSFYYAWSPFPIFRYRSHIGLYINNNHYYNYAYNRRCQVAYNNYYNGRRANGYERQYPNRSFSQRNSGYTNRYELDKTRNIRTVGSVRNDNNSNGGTRNYSSRNNTDVTPRTNQSSTRNKDYAETTPRTNQSSTRDNTSVTPRTNQGSTRNNDTEVTPRTSQSTPRATTPRSQQTETPRATSSPRSSSYDSPRATSSPRSTSSSPSSQSRGNSSGSSSNSGGRSSRR